MTTGSGIILVVDDNPGEIALMTEALEACSGVVELCAVTDAIQGVAYLEQVKSTPLAGRPALILLDLNMPDFSGIHILDYIKGDPALRDIPVIMWTSSDRRSDRELCDRLGADDYLVKPMEVSAYRTIIREVTHSYVGDGPVWVHGGHGALSSPPPALGSETAASPVAILERGQGPRSPRRHPLILQVEDSRDFAAFTSECCRAYGCRAEIRVAGDGEDAIAALRAACADAWSRPDLILLDLDLPGIQGHDVLFFINGQLELRAIPAIVVSSSDKAADRACSLALGAAEHVRKPSGYAEAMQLIGRLRRHLPAWQGEDAWCAGATEGVRPPTAG